MSHSDSSRLLAIAAICLLLVGCASTPSTRADRKAVQLPRLFHNVTIDKKVTFHGGYEVITHRPALETGLLGLAAWKATEARRQEEKKEWETEVHAAANEALARHLRKALGEQIRRGGDVGLVQSPATNKAKGVFRISVIRYGQRFEKGFWKNYVKLFAEISVALYEHKGGLTESYEHAPVWEHRFVLSDDDRTSLPHESGLRPSRMQRDLVEEVFRTRDSIDSTFGAVSRFLLDSAF